MIKRFNPELNDIKYTEDVEIAMAEDPLGEYVKFEDVLFLLQNIGNAIVDDNIENVNEMIEDEISLGNTIDLSKCKVGDKLRIRLNDELVKLGLSDIAIYKGPLPDTDYYDHNIQYSDGTRGTRANNGSTYKRKKRPSDPDVIEILGGK